MPVRHEWDAVTDVIERCRALWGLTEVPKPTADEMAAEFEAHLREHVAAGGAIEDVVGTDLRRGMGHPAAGIDADTASLLRAVNPLTTVATYAVVAHAVVWIQTDGSTVPIPPSDLIWLGGLVTATLLVTRPGVLRRILTSRRRAPALLAALALGVVAVAVPALARTRLLSGAPVAGWPWWATLLPFVAAIASPGWRQAHGPRPIAASARTDLTWLAVIEPGDFALAARFA